MTLPPPPLPLFFDLPPTLPIRIFRDDGKRASAAIEVLRAQAPLERGLGKTIGAEITGF